MNRFLLQAATMLLLPLVAGCAATTSSPQPPATQQVAASDGEFGRLAARKLSKGSCGLFLWTKSSDRKLVFFSTPNGGASVVLGGAEVELERSAVEGAEVLGLYERQTFIRPNERLQVTVGFERRPGMDRGVVVPQGSLRLVRPDGWEMILPVGGLVACEQ